ncbi:hypothetical protein SFRURICE_001618 [Spodoptera frugiperda]|nr:hypothetical protein SFRURICE_001618 [Spodoptera frugiperda]
MTIRRRTSVKSCNEKGLNEVLEKTDDTTTRRRDGDVPRGTDKLSSANLTAPRADIAVTEANMGGKQNSSKKNVTDGTQANQHAITPRQDLELCTNFHGPSVSAFNWESSGIRFVKEFSEQTVIPLIIRKFSLLLNDVGICRNKCVFGTMRSTRTYNWERKRVYVEIIRKGKAHKTKLRHVDGAETARAAGALIKQEFTVFKRKLTHKAPEFDPIIKPGRLKFGPIR